MAKKTIAGLSLEWHKSSHSNGNGGNNCVEGRITAKGDNLTVEVRDSKDPTGPTLTFTRGEWKAFVAGVQDGEFNIKG